MTLDITREHCRMEPKARRVAALLFLACAALTVGHVLVFPW
jgi:hypothetical protein